MKENGVLTLEEGVPGCDYGQYIVHFTWNNFQCKKGRASPKLHVNVPRGRGTKDETPEFETWQNPTIRGKSESSISSKTAVP
jgi:hypothetical protein